MSSARLLLLGLLALVLLARGMPASLGSARVGSGRVPPPPPVHVDRAVDPAWRLTLLPGVGPVRARAIVRAREARLAARRAAAVGRGR